MFAYTQKESKFGNHLNQCCGLVAEHNNSRACGLSCRHSPRTIDRWIDRLNSTGNEIFFNSCTKEIAKRTTKPQLLKRSYFPSVYHSLLPLDEKSCEIMIRISKIVSKNNSLLIQFSKFSSWQSNHFCILQ